MELTFKLNQQDMIIAQLEANLEDAHRRNEADVDRIAELEEELSFHRTHAPKRRDRIAELEAENKRFKKEYEVNMHNLLDRIYELEAALEDDNE